MRKLISIITVLLLALSLTAAVGGNPHYVEGPDFEFNDEVTATGSIAGLGNWDIDLLLETTVEVNHDCRNPGGNIAPGQSKEFTASAGQTGLEPDNGRVNFSITAPVPDEPPFDLADACPNPRWDVVNVEMTAIDATLFVWHGGEPQPDLTAHATR